MQGKRVCVGTAPLTNFWSEVIEPVIIVNNISDHLPIMICSLNVVLNDSIKINILLGGATSTSMQVCAFCVNGPLVWNGLPLELRLLTRTLSATLYRRLKTILFDRV